MAWRLARSLETLRDEIRRVAPGTTVWTIGDASHAAGASDHNPNAAGVVCAIDVLGDHGLDLADFADHVRTSGHPALKYVIYNRRIASAGAGWRAYHGSNPHTSHVHVSVGRGPDGRSTGPYDDTSPWGLASTSGGSMLGLREGDSGDRVKVLQYKLYRAGFPPIKGDLDRSVDGVYGPATSAAVLACRKAQGSSATHGRVVDYWAVVQIDSALAEARAGSGRQGPPGPPGPRGEQGPPGPPG
ncbi:MAG TPA: peptidoglycan-binding protein, partial [Natronosporangium sp.]|nr:peptidoglycan-binding protein [Natronosporangium sp.]